MKAIGKYCVVRKANEDVKGVAGLVLSKQDAERDRYCKAEMVSPGTDVSSTNKGDIVLVDKFSGFDTVIEGDSVTVLMEKDIVLVLSEGSAS